MNRHAENVSILTGRSRGKFLQEGCPRGGGAHCHTEIRKGILFKAIQFSAEEVLKNLGVADGGQRTPYEDLHAAVEETPMTEIVQFDALGRPIHRTRIIGSGDNTEILF